MEETYLSLPQRKERIVEIYNWFFFNRIIKNQTDFANIIGYDRSTVNQALKGSEKALTRTFISICEKAYNENKKTFEYTDIVPPTISEQFNKDTTQALVPTIPYRIYTETGVDLEKYIAEPDERLHMTPAIAQFSATDMHYFVNSDAMLPHLHPNDVLALKKIPDGATVINGEICVINSKFNGLLARFVYDDGDFIILKASPAQERYTTMRLAKNDIFGIYRILGLIRTNI